MTATIDFMVKLRRIDDAGLTQRDVLILWVVRSDPGVMGMEVAKKLGYNGRSNIQYAIPRLIEKGLMEDRRVKISSVTPNNLHITSAGEKFLTDLVPA